MNPAAVLTIMVKANGVNEAQRDIRSLDDTGKRTTRSMSKMSDGMAKMGGGMGKMAKVGFGAAAVGAGAAGVAFAAFAKTSIGAATDINESLTKNRTLFGKHAKNVETWAATTSQSIGISRQAALEATGTFGNLFTALDVGPKKSADMSKALVTLAGDMASFNNASPEEAMEAIRSGLVGETEPLRRFGVNMNDATLRAQALKDGLIKTTKEALDPKTKAMAAYGLMFKQTSKAQGDFERTSGGLANQQRIMKARFDDVTATLGQKMLPIATTVVTAVNDMMSAWADGEGPLARIQDVAGQVFQKFRDGVGAIVDFGQRVRDTFSGGDKEASGSLSNIVNNVRDSRSS
jgi:hypothetical protein